ncbi:MAG: hypothetical protein ACYSW6_11685 [Planctomycetota bacterium]|jgi:hypothetical protein
MPKNENTETLIAYGGAVKALGDGKVGGYLVRFTTEDEPDLEGEYFTADTDFGEAESAPVHYQHGMDAKIGKRRIGRAEHKKDEFGVWAEAQLNLRVRYCFSFGGAPDQRQGNLDQVMAFGVR